MTLSLLPRVVLPSVLLSAHPYSSSGGGRCDDVVVVAVAPEHRAVGLLLPSVGRLGRATYGAHPVVGQVLESDAFLPLVPSPVL